jgi:hypothetical protein
VLHVAPALDRRADVVVLGLSLEWIARRAIPTLGFGSATSPASGEAGRTPPPESK